VGGADRGSADKLHTKDGQFGGSSDPVGDAPAPGKVLELKKTHMMVDVSLKCFPNIHLGISHA